MKTFVKFLLAIFLAYFVFATFTFQIRHPWATDMEILLNIGNALKFKEVPYNEMRLKYEREKAVD